MAKKKQWVKPPEPDLVKWGECLCGAWIFIGETVARKHEDVRCYDCWEPGYHLDCAGLELPAITLTM